MSDRSSEHQRSREALLLLEHSGTTIVDFDGHPPDEATGQRIAQLVAEARAASGTLRVFGVRSATEPAPGMVSNDIITLIDFNPKQGPSLRISVRHAKGWRWIKKRCAFCKRIGWLSDNNRMMFGENSERNAAAVIAAADVIQILFGSKISNGR